VGTITFTAAKLERLKRAYRRAVSAKQTSFVFEGQELDVKYAMYLIEYLDNMFKATR